MDDQGVLQFLEFGKLKPAFCKGGVEPVDFGFEGGKLRFDAVNVLLPHLRLVVLPQFDLGKEFLFPFVGDRDERRVPFHFPREFFFADEIAVLAMLLLVLVGATVVKIPAPALFGVALGGDAVAARTTSGEIEKEKSLVAALVAVLRLSDLDKCVLDFVKRLFGNHRRVDALVHLPLVEEDPVIEGVAQYVPNRGKRQGLFAQIAHNADCRQLLLDGGQRVLAGGKKLHDALDLGKKVGVWLNRAEPRFIDISERGLARIYPPADFLPDTAPDVHGQVPDILVCHPEFNRDHEHIVGRQIRLLERADFADDAALEKTDDPAAVIEIAGQSVQLPCQNAIGFACFNAPKHVIEDRTARLLGAPAFGEGGGDGQAVPRGDGVQFGSLRVNREDLTVFVLGGFAAVYEK